MAAKALNFRLEEEKTMKNPYDRLTANVRNASPEESADILAEIENLSDDDLSVACIREKKK